MYFTSAYMHVCVCVQQSMVSCPEAHVIPEFFSGTDLVSESNDVSPDTPVS